MLAEDKASDTVGRTLKCLFCQPNTEKPLITPVLTFPSEREGECESVCASVCMRVCECMAVWYMCDMCVSVLSLCVCECMCEGV